MHLYPRAWLKVFIRNESGAYGFYPEQSGSGKPPINLGVNRDSLIQLISKKGNAKTTYGFSVIETEAEIFPDSNYWKKVKVLINNQPIPLKIGIGAFITFDIVEQDTTTLTIVY